eukprot:CAMPEP_0177671400 /NCGR_PEP_ID=MMETSP0447-20121125/24681_1 /TAXON_ID=0 /ORGANISM="Stygamoeba regulata, Strain BSH-02190019" /LENGTH=62 /DNA_ID=CAMNT_0019178785 /DNA_START=49 /DNA_END=234 /DNA_ORIENTATION=-
MRTISPLVPMRERAKDGEAPPNLSVGANNSNENDDYTVQSSEWGVRPERSTSYLTLSSVPLH